MQGLRIFSRSGAAPTSEEIEAAHRVANTHREMRFGVVRASDKTNGFGVDVEYHPLKRIAFVESSPLQIATIYQDETGIFLHYPPYRADKEEFPGSTVYISKAPIRLDGFGLPEDISFADLRIDGKTLRATTNQLRLDVVSERSFFHALFIERINKTPEENIQVITTVSFPDESFPGAAFAYATPGYYQSCIAPNGTIYLAATVLWDNPGLNEAICVFSIDPNTNVVTYAESTYMSGWTGAGPGALSKFEFNYEMLSYVSNGGIFSGTPLYYTDGLVGQSLVYQFFHNTITLYSKVTDLDTSGWDWGGSGAVPGDVYDVSSSPNGQHWIGAFSDPAFGKLYNASGDYITPVVYIVVDGVEHPLNIDCVTNDLIADSAASFPAGIVQLSRSILSRVRFNTSGYIYRDQNKLAISDSGNWAACLLSTGLAVSDTSTCTTNIVHVINGVMFQHVERVFHPFGANSSYIVNSFEILATCRAYISPDDEIALIVAPAYTNRNIGSDISTTDPGFQNDVVNGDMELFIYSLSTNTLVTSHLYGFDSNVNIACVARTSNRTELIKTGTGYRLERIDNGYFAVDITVTEEEGGGKTYTFSEIGKNYVVSNGDGVMGQNGDAESRTNSIYDGTIHRPVTKIR